MRIARSLFFYVYIRDSEGRQGGGKGRGERKNEREGRIERDNDEEAASCRLFQRRRQEVDARGRVTATTSEIRGGGEGERILAGRECERRVWSTRFG